MQRNFYPGKFIVFDGLDGSGQSTQAGKLVDFLNTSEEKFKLGHVGAHLTKEPTSSLIGGLIRSQLTHEWKSSHECLQLLFSADRAHHLEKEIIPILERGVIVVCDRYFFSTIAYGSLDIKDKKWLFDLNRNFLFPDLTFFLKISPKVCIERIQKTRYGITLFEKEELLTKIWENFEKLAKQFKSKNVYIINGERPVDKIFEEVKNLVHSKLNL